MQRHDAGVVEPGGCPRLAEETLHDPRGGVRVLQDLERDVAVQARVVGAIDVAEAAAAQALTYLKTADLGASVPSAAEPCFHRRPRALPRGSAPATEV